MRLHHREPRMTRSSHILLASALLAALSAGPARAGESELTRLPIGAQAAISGTLGRSDRAYHAAREAGGFRASSDAHDLQMRFGRDGIALGFGADRVELSLRAVGYAQRLRPVAATAPTGRSNRVEYARGNLVEWYVNGPIGLGQGVN